MIPHYAPDSDGASTCSPPPSSQGLLEYIELKSLSSYTDSSFSSSEPLLPSLSSPPPANVLSCPKPLQVLAIQSYASAATPDPLDDLFQLFSPTSSRRSTSEKFAKLQELLPPSPADPYSVLQLASLWLSRHYTENPLVETRISDPTSVFTYKKVANKTRPVAMTLPENFRILR